MIGHRDENVKADTQLPPESTIPNKGGKSKTINIPSKGYDLQLVRDAIKEIKKGRGENLRVNIIQESFTIDPSVQPLGLAG